MTNVVPLNLYQSILMIDRKINTVQLLPLFSTNGDGLPLNKEYKAPCVNTLIRIHRPESVRRRLGSTCYK